MPEQPGSTIDWSMGSRTDRILDLDAAAAAARSVAGRGPATTQEQRDRLRRDLGEAVARSSALVQDATGLAVEGPSARSIVLSRGAWADANIRALQRILDPHVQRFLPEGARWSTARRRLIGAQLGAVLGYASRKVLGQYDPFLPPDDDGLLMFVGPNVLEVERTAQVPSADFRLWIALHEVTHRVQFGATPWLRGHLATCIDAYLRSMDREDADPARGLRDALQLVREGLSLRDAVLQQLMTPAQGALLDQVQGIMSLLEGHATYVMNLVGRTRLADLDAMRRAVRRRGRVAGAERVLQRAAGFDRKLRQYASGERFVRRVVDRIGMDGLNAVWSSPHLMPSSAEIAEPDRWLARARKD